MSIKIGGYDFGGPFSASSFLERTSAVYVILRLNPDGRYGIVDVGESGDVRHRVENHERAACWKRHRGRALAVAVGYCNRLTRFRVEQEIRQQYDPACGQC